MHTTTTPSGRLRRITPDDVRAAITRRLATQGASADHLARVLAVAPIEPERPRYIITPNGDGTWGVRGQDGLKQADLYLTSGYLRDQDGLRVDHVLYLTLNLPRPQGQAWHPYAHLLVVPAGRSNAEPLKAHMPYDEAPADADHVAQAAMERARVLLADTWLSGALTALWHRVMEE